MTFCVLSLLGFVCTCDEDSRWIVNTETGLCTTYLCEQSEEICFNDAACVSDVDDAPEGAERCQCRNFNEDDNCNDCECPALPCLFVHTRSFIVSLTLVR